MSYVNKRTEKRNSIEVFSGDDPMCNLANLYERIKRLTRIQLVKMTLVVLIVIGCFIAIYLWFRLKLSDSYS